MAKKKSNKILFILIILAIILILGIGLYFILQNRDNYTENIELKENQKISNNNRFLTLLEQDGNATFTKVSYDEFFNTSSWGPMKLYEKDGKKYFGTDKWYYTFDNKKDQIIYNYDKFKSTFMKKINIKYLNKSFCKDRCNLQVYLFATINPRNPKYRIYTYFVKNPNGINLKDNDTEDLGRISMKVHEYLNDYIRLPHHYDVSNQYNKYARFSPYPIEFGNKIVRRCQGKGTALTYTDDHNPYNLDFTGIDVSTKCLYLTGCTDNFKECCPKHCKWDETKNTIVDGDIDCRNCWLYYKNKDLVDNDGKGNQKKINWFTDKGWRDKVSWYNHQRRDLIFDRSLIQAVEADDKDMFDQLFEKSDLTIKDNTTRGITAINFAIDLGREYMFNKMLKKMDQTNITFDYEQALETAIIPIGIKKRYNIIVELARLAHPNQIARISSKKYFKKFVPDKIKKEVKKILQNKIKECDDRDYKKVDKFGDGCDTYRKSWCESVDTADFDSNNCCICKKKK